MVLGMTTNIAWDDDPTPVPSAVQSAVEDLDEPQHDDPSPAKKRRSGSSVRRRPALTERQVREVVEKALSVQSDLRLDPDKAERLRSLLGAPADDETALVVAVMTRGDDLSAPIKAIRDIATCDDPFDAMLLAGRIAEDKALLRRCTPLLPGLPERMPSDLLRAAKAIASACTALSAADLAALEV